MRIKSIPLIFFFLSINNYAFTQLKLKDFKNFPLGIYFNNYREIKGYFEDKPTLMKGELKDTYQVNYKNVSFDKYGSADYTFQFVNNTLSNVNIEFSFMANQIDVFENFIKSLSDDIYHTKNYYKNSSSNLNMLQTISYIKKACKGEEGPDISNKFRDSPQKDFGQDVFELRDCAFTDHRFFLISVELYQANNQWYDEDEKKQHEYHGGMVGVTISLTNNELQALRVWEINQNVHNYSSFEDQKKVIKLKDDNGIYKLPVKINDSFTLDFVLDLGASDVSLSPDVFSVLYKAGKIEESDFIGTQTYKFADGSTAKSNVVNLKSLMIGDIKLENVRASISNSISAPLLLGQSALKQLGKYSIDNVNKQLVIE
jgi:aspartyl protease family protein